MGLISQLEVNKIQLALKDLYPNTKTFLNYKYDYELLFAIMLSAQSNDFIVNKVTSILFERYKCIKDYNLGNLDKIKEIIKPVGFFNSKGENIVNVSNQLINKYECKVPKDREVLETFKGVGHKTAGVFLGEFYNYNYIPVDCHIIRVSNRIGLVSNIKDPTRIEEILELEFQSNNKIEIHRQLILLGRNICKPKPNCNMCPIKYFCKFYNKD